MEYRGYVLEHAQVMNVHEHKNWTHFGVILNILDEDYTCVGDDLEQLETNFKKLVDDHFDELQSKTVDMEFDLDDDSMKLLAQASELEKYKGMTQKEILTRLSFDLFESIITGE